MAFKIRDIDETQAPLLDHLIELRKRLVRAFLALGIAFDHTLDGAAACIQCLIFKSRHVK